MVRKSASTATESGVVSIREACSRTEEFSVVVADAEEAPDVTLLGSMRDELSEHGTGQVTDQAVGKCFPLGAAFEGPGGKPLN